MGPESRRVNLQPINIDAAQTVLDRTVGEFSQEYHRNEPVLSVFNRGRDRLSAVIDKLKGAISTVAEFRARAAGVGVADTDYNRTYAQVYANESVAASEEAMRTTANDAQEGGWFNGVYSAYQHTGAARLIIGGALIGAGAVGGPLWGFDRQTTLNLYEIGAVVTATGFDGVRAAYLDTTTRMANAGGRVAEISRRWASNAQGWITGDTRDPFNANQEPPAMQDLSQEARTVLADQLEEKLDSEAVRQPRVVGVGDLREATARVAGDFDLIEPTVRAQAAARTARGWRIAGVLAVAALALTHHFIRQPDPKPVEDCGNVEFGSPDWLYEKAIGTPEVHSLVGQSQARAYRYVVQRDFDLMKPDDWSVMVQLDKGDPTFGPLVGIVADLYKGKNDDGQMRMRTGDTFSTPTGEIREVCDGEIANEARNLPIKPAVLVP